MEHTRRMRVHPPDDGVDAARPMPTATRRPHAARMMVTMRSSSHRIAAGSNGRVHAARRRTRILAIHAAVFAMVNGFMIATWAMTRVFPVEEGDRRPPTAFWPGWLLVTWGTLLALHGVYVWARRGAPAGAPGWASDRGPGRIVATVLFTDIVESTRLAAELGDRRWGELLERHDRRARRLIERFGGWMVKTLGDGLLAIFRTPQDAILSAAALRDDLATDGIEIRVGVHTGEVDLREGDVGGIGVHIAARVMSAAGASEILASRTVRDLVAGSEIAFADRGLHRLKGVDGEWQLFSVARVGSSG